MRSGVPFKLVRPLCFPRSRQRITRDAMRRGGKNCGTWWCAGPNCLIDFSSLLTIYDDSRNRTKLRMVLNETTDVQGSARRIVSFWIPRRRNACSFVCFSMYPHLVIWKEQLAIMLLAELKESVANANPSSTFQLHCIPLMLVLWNVGSAGHQHNYSLIKTSHGH